VTRQERLAMRRSGRRRKHARERRARLVRILARVAPKGTRIDPASVRLRGGVLTGAAVYRVPNPIEMITFTTEVGP
jgi:hypothetical protein